MSSETSTAAYVDSLRPAGSKRSSKRDRIVDVFLRQDGHLTADDLVDLIRKEDQRISRATVYRTLAWMEAAGIARKVDFGEGRFRFEHSYRHPRHFHLICKSCNQQMEFLSSDIEQMIEEVAEARRFAVSQAVVQLYGTCEACTTGQPATTRLASTESLFARDALRIAIATERSGREFYQRASAMTSDARARSIFERLSTDEDDHLDRLEKRYAQLIAEEPDRRRRPAGGRGRRARRRDRLLPPPAHRAFRRRGTRPRGPAAVPVLPGRGQRAVLGGRRRAAWRDQ